tara:strand:+ start:52 stop:177 length:126 start_codon:yes stop_codon:yes gene_type:complete
MIPKQSQSFTFGIHKLRMKKRILFSHKSIEIKYGIKFDENP